MYGATFDLEIQMRFLFPSLFADWGSETRLSAPHTLLIPLQIRPSPIIKGQIWGWVMGLGVTERGGRGDRKTAFYRSPSLTKCSQRPPFQMWDIKCKFADRFECWGIWQTAISCASATGFASKSGLQILWNLTHHVVAFNVKSPKLEKLHNVYLQNYLLV